MAAETRIHADAAALAQDTAAWIVEAALASTGRFALNLSGGSTPKALYGLLAQPPLRDRMPWERVHLFWGDERFVPRDHPDSNFRMVYEAMIAHVPIPPGNVHGMPTGGTPAEGAVQYERTLQAFYGSATLDPGRPLFDITLLGLGEDGHTASLFPGTAALEERAAWVVDVVGAKPEPRLTMTYPVLESSRTVAFLLAGAAKHAMLGKLEAGDASLPAARVHPQGRLLLLVDRAGRRRRRGMIERQVLVVMGVSGSGKTTIAKAVAERLGWPFQEGDDLHPAANVAKMHAGTPLTDEDRAPWLAAIAAWIDARLSAGEPGVVTCSALRHAYREVLVGDRPHVRVVYLHADRLVIAGRLAVRHGHFMPASLLDSQFATLEEPTPDEHAVTVEVAGAADDTVDAVIRALEA